MSTQRYSLTPQPFDTPLAWVKSGEKRFLSRDITVRDLLRTWGRPFGWLGAGKRSCKYLELKSTSVHSLFREPSKSSQKSFFTESTDAVHAATRLPSCFLASMRIMSFGPKCSKSSV